MINTEKKSEEGIMVKIQPLKQDPFKKQWQQPFHFLIQYSYTWNTYGGSSLSSNFSFHLVFKIHLS